MLGKRRPAGAHISGPTPLWLSLLPCLGIYAVSTDERFQNQSSWGSFVVVSGSTMPWWKLLDYVFRTSPEIHLDDPLAPASESLVRDILKQPPSIGNSGITTATRLLL